MSIHFIFYRTNDVFVAEELLQNNGIKTEIVPTPVQDKAYCGVCIKICSQESAKCTEVLSKMDYQLVE